MGMAGFARKNITRFWLSAFLNVARASRPRVGRSMSGGTPDLRWGLQGDFGDGEVEGSGGGVEEAFGRIGERDFQLAVVLFRRGQMGFAEKMADGVRAIFCGVHQRDGGAGDSGDGFF
jgi:hypothetical protein